MVAVWVCREQPGCSYYRARPSVDASMCPRCGNLTGSYVCDIDFDGLLGSETPECVVCDGPFTTVEWSDRHDVEGGVVHDRCCPREDCA